MTDKQMLMKIWICFLNCFMRCILALRYRIRVQGLENIDPSFSKGTVFLPNHPAEIDPVMLMLVLWRKFQLKPLVLEKFYYLKGAHYIQRLAGAIPIPDLSGYASSWKENKIEKIFQQICEGLQEGKNYLIYPSGRLKAQAEEIVGGASFVHRLIHERPQTNVVLIRTTGLWGSRFSTALTGVTPDFSRVLWEGIKILLKNGIFFLPRRTVNIEIEKAPQDLPNHSSRLEFNRYLERWYNAKGYETLNFVSETFWKKTYPKIQRTPSAVSSTEWKIDPQAEQEIYHKISQLTGQKVILRSNHLARDLGLDSFDSIQLLLFLESKYEIENVSVESIETVEDVLKAVGEITQSKKVVETTSTQANWPKEKKRPPIHFAPGKTIQEAFLRSCQRMGKSVACADQTLGIINYRRLKMLAILLSSKIKQLEGDHIGILLPSSIMVYILIFATLLSKKVPVMVNWTVGTRTIDHCIKTAQLKTILSSQKFLENLNHGPMGLANDLLLLVEDIKQTIPFKEKLRAFYQSFFLSTKRLLKTFGLTKVSEDDPAVILFTSGTELLSKGVPLTHKNLLSNERSGLSCVQFLSTDALYGVLPPFHSFGFSLTGLLPIFIGLKVYYAPDPTNSRGMANDIENWQLTIFCCAPTFIKGLYRVAAPTKLQSLRYVITGAEKAPEELFAFTRKLGGQLIEGYGITECSPIVTLTRPELPHRGVGQPIPGVELCIINPETQEKLPPGKEGEICIHGPNIFQGYLDRPQSPFIEIDQKRWYRSGDIGFVDPDNFLILSGRLKRFVKIGGEMISLGGLETEISRLATEKQWISNSSQEGVHLAIAAAERESARPLIILFTTFDVNKETVNESLRACGYGRLIKVSEVRKIHKIPVSTTGKIQYRVLDEMVSSLS